MKYLALLPAALLIGCASSPTAPQRAPLGDPAGVIMGAEGSRIMLWKEPGECVGNARAAEWRPQTGDPILGCWLTNGRDIRIAFRDGDVLVVPLDDVKPPHDV